MTSVVSDFGPGWEPTDKVAYWDGCRQTLEEADDRVNQIVSSVLTYIPALAGAGLSVLAVTAASQYFFGYIAGLIIGVAGIGMTHESKGQADSAFDTLSGAIDVMKLVEGQLGLREELRMSTQIGVIRDRRLARPEGPGRKVGLQSRFDRFCTGLYVAFGAVTGLSALGLLVSFVHV
jgi:hypothetical protein